MLRTPVVLMAALIALSAPALADQVPIPPPPTQWVTDAVGFLSPQTRDALSQKLQTYERSTGHQVIVWIGQTTGDAALEDWTIRAFEKWRVGRKGLDDGVILFVFAQDRKIRIEVGYGLESVLPDARAAEIIRNQMTPRLRAGDKDGAVTAGADGILAVLSGQPEPANQAAPAANPAGLAIGIAFALIAFAIPLIIIISAMRRAVLYHIPGRRYQGVPWIAMLGSSDFGGGGGGSDFGGGGGGFSGGGGMGGGGGASGGW